MMVHERVAWACDHDGARHACGCCGLCGRRVAWHPIVRPIPVTCPDYEDDRPLKAEPVAPVHQCYLWPIRWSGDRWDLDVLERDFCATVAFCPWCGLKLEQPSWEDMRPRRCPGCGELKPDSTAERCPSCARKGRVSTRGRRWQELEVWVVVGSHGHPHVTESSPHWACVGRYEVYRTEELAKPNGRAVKGTLSIPRPKE
jgi:hypothetical protein